MRSTQTSLTSKDVKELGLAVRTGNHHGALHSSGYVQCRHCGSTLASLSKVAEAIGVSVSTLNKWLKRETIRQDLATRIRAAFARIEE